MTAGNPQRPRQILNLGWTLPARSLLAIGLLALTCAVYAQVGGHDFVDWDDPVGILDNPALRATGPIDAVERAFTSTLNANWIPLTVLSLQASYAAHGLEPAGYLLANVALHATAVLLLFLALARMTRAPGACFFVAALFAVHPLHVESVAWASARKDVLSGAFWMAALYAHARHAEAPRRGSSLWVLLCVAGALLSKPTAVTLPCVLLLLDYWPLGRLGERRAWLEKIPQFVLVTAASATTLAVQGAQRAMSYGEQMSPLLRLTVGVEAYAIYLGQAVWPRSLAYFYPHPALLGEIRWLPGVLAALLLAALSAGALALRRSHPHLIVGWLWYVGTLIPVIGWVQVGGQAHADRYTYLPLVGLAIAVVFEGQRATAGRPRARKAVVATGMLIVGVLAGAASRQVAVWHDSLALKSHAVEVTQPNFVAYQGLASALVRAGRLDEAEPYLKQAAEMNPSAADPLLDLADLAARRGRSDEALALYRDVTRQHPDDARAQANLGLALARSGQTAEGRIHLERALELGRPRSVSTRRWAGVELALARLCEAASDSECARLHYGRGLSGRPDDDAARQRLEKLAP